MSFSGAISKALTAVFIASYDSAEAKIQLTEQQFKKLHSKLAYIDYAINANNAIALERDRTRWYTNINYRKSGITIIATLIQSLQQRMKLHINWQIYNDVDKDRLEKAVTDIKKYRDHTNYSHADYNQNIFDGLQLCRAICEENLLVNAELITDKIVWQLISKNKDDNSRITYKGRFSDRNAILSMNIQRKKHINS